MNLAEILALGGGALPPVEQFDPEAHALLVPPNVRDVAMQAQAENMPAAWCHRMEPVKINGETFYGIGADVLTEAIAPGIFAFIFQNLDPSLAADVQIIPFEQFTQLLEASQPQP